MRAALLRDNVVQNVIRYDPEANFDPGEGTTLVTLPEGSPVGIGWTRDGESFVAPVEDPGE